MDGRDGNVEIDVREGAARAVTQDVSRKGERVKAICNETTPGIEVSVEEKSNRHEMTIKETV